MMKYRERLAEDERQASAAKVESTSEYERC
ncbi:hypothetical protein YIM_30025 [Amycolatopsis sp. YIM 10]|nr:hypothetical protein YIM_30025 [Amycolatopsis sp. YIM 10]